MGAKKDQKIRDKAKEHVTKMNETVNNVADVVNEATESIVSKGVEVGLSLKDTFNQLKKTKVKLVKE